MAAACPTRSTRRTSRLQGLAHTLTDFENLSFNSLARGIAGHRPRRSLEAAIQALIFRAIMGARRRWAPTRRRSAGAAPVTGLSAGKTRTRIFAGGRLKRMARGGFITNRPMIMPMADRRRADRRGGPGGGAAAQAHGVGQSRRRERGWRRRRQQINNIDANSTARHGRTLYNLAVRPRLARWSTPTPAVWAASARSRRSEGATTIAALDWPTADSRRTRFIVKPREHVVGDPNPYHGLQDHAPLAPVARHDGLAATRKDEALRIAAHFARSRGGAMIFQIPFFGYRTAVAPRPEPCS